MPFTEKSTLDTAYHQRGENNRECFPLPRDFHYYLMLKADKYKLNPLMFLFSTSNIKFIIIKKNVKTFISKLSKSVILRLFILPDACFQF